MVSLLVGFHINIKICLSGGTCLVLVYSKWAVLLDWLFILACNFNEHGRTAWLRFYLLDSWLLRLWLIPMPNVFAQNVRWFNEIWIKIQSCGLLTKGFYHDCQFDSDPISFASKPICLGHFGKLVCHFKVLSRLGPIFAWFNPFIPPPLCILAQICSSWSETHRWIDQCLKERFDHWVNLVFT